MKSRLPVASTDPTTDPAFVAAKGRLRKALGKALVEYGMLAANDRVMVCLSGGKDSYTLLTLLDELRPRAPLPFELIPVHLDQKQPGYDGSPLIDWLEARGGRYHIIEEDTYSIVVEKLKESQTYCSLCARLRRGILYTAARHLKCTKIALGHHRDDAVETVLLNMFFQGQTKTMPPILRSDDGHNCVIRPLYYASEADIEVYAAGMNFPILPCNLCGSQDGLWRKQVKELLTDLEQRIPHVRATILTAMRNVKPTHLPDTLLWERLGIEPSLNPHAPPPAPPAPPDQVD